MQRLDDGVLVPIPKNAEAARPAGVENPAEETPEIHVDVKEPRFRLPSVVLATLGVLAVLVLAYLAYQLLPVLLLLYVSILFATAIEPVVNWLRRGPFNRMLTQEPEIAAKIMTALARRLRFMIRCQR